MQSPRPTDETRDTPFTTPLMSADEEMSPTTADASQSGDTIDPLVAQTAKKIADVINDFKRQLDDRDGIWATANGSFELALKTNASQTYKLSITPDTDGDAYPITVSVDLKQNKQGANGSIATSLTAAVPGTQLRTRRDSDAELEKDVVSRKRKIDNGEDTMRKRARTDDGDADDDIMSSFISKGDLEDFLFKLREDVQEDTSECVNHVQKLLRRFKEEWHDRCNYEDDQTNTLQSRPPMRGSITGNGATPGVSFPSPSLDRDDTNKSSVSDTIRRESKLLSTQIRWVEDCRRVAADIHDKKEENWRTSSAGFHDRNRQDRENFQNRMLNESQVQGRVINQILNEVKAIGLYTQSMKWETPNHLATHPAYPPQPTVPAFPTQHPPPTPAVRPAAPVANTPVAIPRASNNRGPTSGVPRQTSGSSRHP